MHPPRTRYGKRRAAIAPLTAILMVPVLGMCAFSIDSGYIILCQTDLQHAADSGALAGAEQMQELYVQYTSPGLTASQLASVLSMATTNVAPSGSVPGSPMYTAEQFAHYNKAGGVFITVPDSDVVFGYTDASGNYSSTYIGFPNTITVTTRRDTTANDPIDLFFGPIFNKAQQSLTAVARATIYSGDVSSLKVIPGVDAHILPVALDINVWKTFYLTGLSPDGLIHYAANGRPQLQVYPTATNTPGSFGLLDIGQPANDTPAFRNWIDDGATPNNIQYLLDSKLLPVSVDAPQSWKCGPGLKSTLLSNFQGEMGKPNQIPLFVPAQTLPSYVAATGNGQNATYAVVGFVGVTITEADGHGSNMNISIQPMGTIDPTSTFTSTSPAGTSTSQFGTPQTTYISAKLTK